MMEKARIIKIISNQYDVMNAQNERMLCVAMGKLRKHQTPVVGDMVEIERFDDQVGIQKVLPRKNELRRPAIANVDQAIIVMSCKDPDFSSTLIDRLIFQIVYANITPIICITKLDLIDEDDPIHTQIQAYRDSGYTVYMTGKGYANEGIKDILKGKISVLTGQSGAGKSSLLNRIEPSFHLHTQEISKALGRGKHTTRHCELHWVQEGWVADTPGFSSMDFSHMDVAILKDKIPDFQQYLYTCRFKDCIHINEPGCQIQEGVANHKISKQRYEHYKEVVAMIQASRQKY